MKNKFIQNRIKNDKLECTFLHLYQLIWLKKIVSCMEVDSDRMEIFRVIYSGCQKISDCNFKLLTLILIWIDKITE